jgi:hypothetical protein
MQLRNCVDFISISLFIVLPCWFRVYRIFPQLFISLHLGIIDYLFRFQCACYMSRMCFAYSELLLSYLTSWIRSLHIASTFLQVCPVHRAGTILWSTALPTEDFMGNSWLYRSASNSVPSGINTEAPGISNYALSAMSISQFNPFSSKPLLYSGVGGDNLCRGQEIPDNYVQALPWTLPFCVDHFCLHLLMLVKHL